MSRVRSITIAVAMLASAALPAAAASGIGGGDPGPVYGYEVNSFISPTHLGNHVVGSGVGYDGGDPETHCWDEFADIVYPDPLPDGYEPTPELVEAAVAALPPECSTRDAVQLRAPEVLVDNCPTGTVFGVRGQVRWYPGTPMAAPGRYTFTGLTGSPTVDEVVFNTCLEIFDPGTDVAHIEELVPTPSFGKSPEVVGLTGLDTWLWYDFTDPASHSVSATTVVDRIQGLPITIQAQAWVDAVQWDMDGDGEWDTSVDIPDPSWHEPPTHDTFLAYGGGNSAEDAAATWLYETKGAFTVNVGVVWRGFYTVTVPNLGGIYQYTPVTRIESFPYQVCELRAVITTPGEHPNLDTCPLP